MSGPSLAVAHLLRSRRKELGLKLREVEEATTRLGQVIPISSLSKIERAQLEPGQIRSAGNDIEDIGLDPVGGVEAANAAEPRLPEVGVEELRPVEPRLAQLRADQPRAREIGPAEVRSREIGAGEVQPGEVLAPEPKTPQVLLAG